MHTESQDSRSRALLEQQILHVPGSISLEGLVKRKRKHRFALVALGVTQLQLSQDNLSRDQAHAGTLGSKGTWRAAQETQVLGPQGSRVGLRDQSLRSRHCNHTCSATS